MKFRGRSEKIMRHHLAGGVDWNVYRCWADANSWVTTLRVVWIEIIRNASITDSEMSPPCGWCGLKFLSLPDPPCLLGHHLAGGVDWNYPALNQPAAGSVTTLRVVWIEISRIVSSQSNSCPSPPCGWCGLKCKADIVFAITDGSPPCGWCGLKCS